MGIAKQLSEADLVIVGAGLFGMTIAERAASVFGKRSLIIEQRNHIGGNAFSYFDPETSVEVHKYGTHIFHTENTKVFEYLSLFTEFNDYKHHVWTKHKGQTYPMPIGLATLNAFYKRDIDPQEAKRIIQESASSVTGTPSNLEDKAISLIGEDLYRAFIEGYTAKQWQTDPKLLPPDIISRLPVRYNFETRYFTDKYEGLPKDGYGAWFENMVKSDLINVATETDFFEIKSLIPQDKLVIFTGPIDQYFDFEYGLLSWRTLDLESEVIDVDDYQGTSVMNYADQTEPWTRIHEFKHLHPERQYVSGKTFVMKEFSRAALPEDEKYYPVNTPEDREKIDKYRKLAKEEPNTLFGGRLGSYKYLDMHMAVASALVMFENEITPIFNGNNHD